VVAVVVRLTVETTSPGLAVPEDSTTSLVFPLEGGLNGAGPEADPARSHGFGGGPLPDVGKQDRRN
jgi:hypothetical protein